MNININFKIISVLLILVLFSVVLIARNQTEMVKQKQENVNSDKSNYQLFPTKNYWTFIKLDTRNGKMWQVHFTVDNVRGELSLNKIPLVTADKEVNGRFTLYPTENIYNFLLLDQINGKTYQVQWSTEEKNRVVLPID
jgi:hypothetical protein